MAEYKISNGVISSGLTLNGDYVYVYSGGSLVDVKVSGGAAVTVEGGTVNGATVSGGYIYVHSGAVSGDVDIQKGEMVVSSGSVEKVEIANGVIHASNGANISSVEIDSNGRFYVSNGASVGSAVVSGGGYLAVYESGVVSGANLKEQGVLYVSSGATVSNFVWNPGDGTLSIEQGATVKPVSSYKGVYWGVDGKATGHYNSNGILTSLDNYTRADELLRESANQTASGVGIGKYDYDSVVGNMYVMSGGNVFALPVTSGDMHIWGGGSGAFLQVDGGRLFVSGGAKVYGAVATGNGLIEVYSGAHVCNNTEYQTPNGGLIANVVYDRILDAAQAQFAQQHIGAIGVMGPDAQVNIYSGATVIGGALAAHAGTLNVAGNIDSATAYNLGILNVSSGGTIGTLDAYGAIRSSQYITRTSSGAAVGGTTGVFNSNFSAAQVIVNKGGVINGAGSLGLGANVYIMAGGAASDIVIGRELNISSSVSETNVVSTTDTGVEVTSVVTTHTSTNYAAGVMHVYSSGVVTNVKVGGTLNLSGGSASKLSVGGVVNVLNGASATSVTVGYTESRFENEVGSSVSSSTILLGGTLNVSNGGYVKNVSFGNTSARVTVSSGGMIAGALRINASSQLTFVRGGILDFTVADQNPGDDYLVKGFRYIGGSGNAEYTITISDYQANGTYLLVQGSIGASASTAFDPSKTITVQGIVDGKFVSYGGVIANSDALAHNNKFYSLKYDEIGNLSLVVSSGDFTDATLSSPVISSDITSWTSGSVTVTAEFTPVANRNEYSYDGKVWTSYTLPLVANENKTIYFRSEDSIGRKSEVVTYVVGNIDSSAPTFELVAESESYPDYVDISVINVSDYQLDAEGEKKVDENGDFISGSGIRSTDYSFDGFSWLGGSKVRVTADRLKEGETSVTVYFRITDNAGNETIKEYVVDTLGDRLAPVISVVRNDDANALTNSDVILTINVADVAVLDPEDPTAEVNVVSGILKIEYSTDGLTFTEIPAEEIQFTADRSAASVNLTFTENAAVLLRVTDKAYNVSEEWVFIENIDKDAPKVVVSGNATDWTSENVLLTVTASDNGLVGNVAAGVQELQYKNANGEWISADCIELGDGDFQFVFEVTGNGDYEFRATDKVGNTSDPFVVSVTFIDKDAPEITVDGNPEDWTDKDVVLTLNASDNENGSGIARIEYSTDQLSWQTVAGNSYTVGANGEFYFRTVDVAGNISDEVYVNVDKIDKAAPKLVLTPSKKDWTNANVVITAEAADDGSGLAGISYQNAAGWVDGNTYEVSANGTYLFKAIDNVGNSIEVSITIDWIDRVPPTITVSGNPTDWTNADATIEFVAADDFGVIAESKYSLNGTDWFDGTSFTVAGNGKYYVKAVDKAGNETVQEVVVTYIDKDAPVVNISGNPTDWTNADAKLVINAADGEGSGVASILYSYDNKTWVPGAEFDVTANGKYYVKAVDIAGNESVQEVVVTKIDKDAPALAFKQDKDGWTNNDVIISAIGSDEGGSGVKKVEYLLDGKWIVANENTVTANGTYTFKVTDNAGNEYVAEHIVTNIDKNKPTVEVSGNPTDWTNADATIEFVAADDLSGIAESKYSLNGTDWFDGTSFTVAGNGKYYVKAVDKAGNETVQEVVVTRIDKDAPVVNISGNPTDWTNADAKLVINAADGEGSGVASILYSYDNKTWVSGAEFDVTANGTYYIKAVDKAGNETVQQVVVTYIDKIDPSISFKQNVEALTNGDVVIDTISSDEGGSGVKKVEYLLDGKWIAGSQITVSKNGTYTFKVTDNAGNEYTAEHTVTNIDKVAPTLSAVANTVEWTNQNVVFSVTASDDRSSVTLEYTLDNKTWFTVQNNRVSIAANGTLSIRATDEAGNVTVFSDNITNIDKVKPEVSISGYADEWTNQNIGLTLSGTDNASGIVKIEYSTDNQTWNAVSGNGYTVSANGRYYFRTIDLAGNISDVKSIDITKIDKDAPVVQVTANITEWTNSAQIKLSAVTGDGNGSGVKMVEYQLNGAWVSGGEQIVTANGTYYFKAIDNAGNETVGSYTVTNIDRVPPTITVSGNPTEWTNKDTTINFAVDDALSGIAYSQYSLNGTDWVNGTSFTATANGTYYVKAVDKAGNEIVQQVVVTKIDKDAPVVDVKGLPDVWINGDSKLEILAADDISGIASIWYSTDNKNWQSGASFTASEVGTYYVKAIDNAGNETVKAVEVTHVDKIAPTLELTQSVTDWTKDSVVINAVGSDEGGSGVKKIEYQLNGQWVEGTSMTVSANGTYTFKVTDVAGNEYVAEHEVTNIDKAAPTITVSGNPSEWTNKDAVISFVAADALSGIAYSQYSLNGTDWVNGTSFTATANGTYYVKAVDKAGNETVQQVVVTKIDKVAPTVSAAGDLTTWTRELVLNVTASDGEGSGVAETLYSINGSDWQHVENNTIKVGVNGKVSIKTIDAVGNVSEIFTVDVNKVDVTGPETLSFSGNPTAWTNQNVKITAHATDSGSGVAGYYYFDAAAGKWIAGRILEVSANGTYTFKAVDMLGNETVKDVVVTMIDKKAPTVTVSGNATEWTKSDVKLTVNVSDEDSGVTLIEYSFDNKNWSVLNTNYITVNGNKTVYVRATDDAGNVGVAIPVQVTKIDREVPVITVTGNSESWVTTSVGLVISATDAGSGLSKLEYSLDNSKWTAVQSGSKVTVSENCVVYVKATDKLGQVATKEVNVNCIDNEKPEITVSASTTEWSKSDIVLTVNAVDSISSIDKVEYCADNGSWQTIGANGSVTVSKNGTVSFRATDKAGNVTVLDYTVSNIDKDAPMLSISRDIDVQTRKNILVTAEAEDVAGGSGIVGVEYSFDNREWFNGSSVVVSENKTVYFRAIDGCGNVTTKSITIDNIIAEKSTSNLLSNGMSQIVSWDAKKGTVGYVAVDGESAPDWVGVWEWNRAEALMWKVVGVGHFAGSEVPQDGILLYNGFNNTFAAWTDLGTGSYGYVSLSYVDGEFNTKCLADFDGDKYDDVLIYDKNGSFGIVLDGTTYHDIWHSENAATNPWELMGSGSFGGATDKLVVKHDSGHLYLWTNNDASFRSWNWSQEAIGYLGNDWEFVAIGDFSGDGTDDIVVRKLSDNGLWVWEDGKESTAHWVGTPDKGFAVEAVGDYNGDGKDDLLLREHNTGWGGVGYWASADASQWTDLDARIETGFSSNFTIIA